MARITVKINCREDIRKEEYGPFNKFTIHIYIFYSLKKTSKFCHISWRNSTLGIIDDCLGTLAQYKFLWIKIVLSKINRSGKKIICFGLITSLSIGWSLNQRALANIL